MAGDNHYDQAIKSLVGKTIVKATPIYDEGDESLLELQFSDNTYLRLAWDWDDADIYITNDSLISLTGRGV